jgi:hypothetical protein
MSKNVYIYIYIYMWRPPLAAPSTVNPPTPGGENPPILGGRNLCKDIEK